MIRPGTITHRALEAVRAQPGRRAREIATELKLPREGVRRALKYLGVLGLAEAAGPKNSSTWTARQ